MESCDFTLIIPSLDPDEKLSATVHEAIDAGIDDIILVDDGSRGERRHFFDELGQLDCVTVLTHEVNRGKGAALKTAFSYFLENRSGRAGVVTADGDGQHKTSDIIACAKEMTSGEHAVVLGCRDFSLPEVPKKSRFGNALTSGVFKFLCGMRISDTQTGLRAIPTEFLPIIIEAKGSRYEFETNMLLLMNMRRIPYREVKIETVYIDENASSHFRPVRDSLRVYGIIFKYIGSSIFSSVIDVIVFHLLGILLSGAGAAVNIVNSIFHSHISEAVLAGSGIVWLETFLQTALARAVSATVNFTVNKHVVFGGVSDVKRAYARYAVVAVSMMLLSWASVSVLLFVTGLGNATAARTLFKIPVDILLFLLSFRLQQRWVFADRKK